MPGQPTLEDMLSTPLTQALRSTLAKTSDPKVARDLLFLERWELAAPPGTADALRAAQIRRANPELAAAIRVELKARK